MPCSNVEGRVGRWGKRLGGGGVEGGGGHKWKWEKRQRQMGTGWGSHRGHNTSHLATNLATFAENLAVKYASPPDFQHGFAFGELNLEKQRNDPQQQSNITSSSNSVSAQISASASPFSPEFTVSSISAGAVKFLLHEDRFVV